MEPTDRLRRVRLLVRQRMLALGASPDAEPAESILIREGFFCGRRFTLDGLCAVWFVEEQQLKLHGPDGDLLATVDLDRLAVEAADATAEPAADPTEGAANPERKPQAA